MQASRRVIVFYLLAGVFAATSFYSYSLISQSSTDVARLESVFLLNVGLGSLVSLGYFAVRSVVPVRFTRDEGIHVDVRVPAIVLGGSAVASLLYGYLLYKVVLLVVLAPAVLAFILLTAFSVWPFQGSYTMKAAPLSEDWAVAFVAKRQRLKGLVESRSQGFKTLLMESGLAGNPYVISAKSTAYTVIAAFAVIPISAAAYYVFGVFGPVLLSAIPIAYFYPTIRLKDYAQERRSGVEREIPFFAIVAKVLADAGISLYTILKSVSEKQIFPYISREALLSRKYVEVFGLSASEAFEKLAANHPSKSFSNLLTGYTSKVRTGGDVGTFLSGESGALLGELEAAWARYGERAGGLGSMMLTLFVIVPILIMITSLFLPSTSLTYLSAFTFVALPIFTLLLVTVVAKLQPTGQDPLYGNAKLSLFVAIPAAVPSLLLGQFWLAAASAIFLFSVVYGFSVVEKRREISEVDDAISRFLKDLMEYKRQEYDIPKAILNIVAENRYNNSFDRILQRVSVHLGKAEPLSEVVIETRSRLAKVAFYVIGEMAASGGGSVDTLHQLSVYVSKAGEARRRAAAEMKPYIFMSLLSPILLAFGITFTQSVVVSFSSNIHANLSKLPVNLLKIGSVPPELTQLADTLIVLASAALGLVGAKIIDFTVKNTLRVAANVIVAILATYIFGQVNILSLFH